MTESFVRFKFMKEIDLQTTFDSIDKLEELDFLRDSNTLKEVQLKSTLMGFESTQIEVLYLPKPDLLLHYFPNHGWEAGGVVKHKNRKL